MADFELERVRGERRLHVVDGLGALRFEGLASRTALASAGDASWRFARQGLWGRRVEATDAYGSSVGLFEPRAARRGGALYWAGREFMLRPSSVWRERYALVEGEE